MTKDKSKIFVKGGSTDGQDMSKSKYDPAEIEKKWQERWDKVVLYKTPSSLKKKKYILDMFPYPSGATLHVGHIEGYVGTDIISRYERMKGNSVLHPMGWDAFGLPSENYAIKTGVPPNESTHKNIDTFKRQLRSLGMSYDWEQEIDTSDPDFYRWTQWLFKLMFKRGLAYKRKAAVNWCPSCETVLANEQVINGKCERCETEVILKELDQWFFKITEYADRLISGLDDVDWLDEVKVQQRNWIGKSYGCEIEFEIVKSEPSNGNEAGIGDVERQTKDDTSIVTIQHLTCFTTRPDTLYGVTFVVIAPDSDLVEQLVTPDQKKQVDTYLASQGLPFEPEVDIHNKSKEGVWTGSYVVNPATGKNVPVWLANYVVSGYGAEAVMGVPAHDQRDFEFAKKYDLEIMNVIASPEGVAISTKEDPHANAQDDIATQAYVGSGLLVNSGEWNGFSVPEDLDKIILDVEAHGWGSKKTQYHLRDWLISRQRYWGAPIPMIFCKTCHSKGVGEREDMPGWYTVGDADLPVLLPIDIDFKPTGESPIERSKSFQEGVVCPNCGEKAKREVDTMDTFVDSSWYFIRFVDNKNKLEFASKEKMKAWLPVDVYVGGGHVVQHLLFARFFWKVLFDAELLEKSLGDEPFLKLRAPGWILGSDSRKMSKRFGNVVTPDDIIPKYGADTLRMYEMFMGPFEAMKPWGLTGVEGMSRFINKIWRLFEETHSTGSGQAQDKSVDVLMNRLVMKVGNDIESMSFNTAISSMMIAYNSLIEMRQAKLSINWKETWEKFLLVIAPFMPHLAEELWQDVIAPVRQGGNKVKQSQGGDRHAQSARDNTFKSIHSHPWPQYDPALIVEDVVEIPVQINGKHRGTVQVQVQDSENREIVEAQARKNESVSKHLEGVIAKKVIFVPGKLINFVV